MPASKAGPRCILLPSEERLESIPGMDSAAISYVTPLSGSTWQSNIKIAEPSGERASHAFFNVVSPDFFRTYSTPILQGRPIAQQDRMGSPQVVVVNREFMKSILRDGNIAGRRIRADTGAAIHLDLKSWACRRCQVSRSPRPRTADHLRADGAGSGSSAGYGDSDPNPHCRSGGYARCSPDAGGVKSEGCVSDAALEQQVSDSLVNERAIAAVAGLFGALALVLAAVGIYGLAAYSVMRRRAEIGIRMALGATGRRVVTALFGQTLTVVIAGVLAGALVAAWSARFADALFFGVTASSIWVYGVSATALVLTSGLAILGPSARAVSPILPARFEARNKSRPRLRRSGPTRSVRESGSPISRIASK